MAILLLDMHSIAFQSASALASGRSTPLRKACRMLCFNPRPPSRADDWQNPAISKDKRVSIRVRPRERTIYTGDLTFTITRDVSIRVRPRERTMLASKSTKRIANRFNPRPPSRADDAGRRAIFEVVASFNPRPPSRADD